MYWQLHLASQPLRSLHLLSGRPSLLAVRASREQVNFYDLNTGAQYDDLHVDLDVLDNDMPEERRTSLEALRAPNGEYLPYLELNASDLHISEDGQLRLIHDYNAGLTLENGLQSVPLDIPNNQAIKHVSLDRDLGTIAALTEQNVLHIYQQQTRMNTISLANTPMTLFISTGGEFVLLVEPGNLRRLDTAGKVLRTAEIHYTVGPVAMSPDGNWLMVGDADHQLLRLYNRDLILIRQQHGVDLLSRARPVQLFVDVPTPSAPLAALDITNEGVFSFAVAGILCTAHIDLMTELPQTRLLL
jgi:hypothetical protein